MIIRSLCRGEPRKTSAPKREISKREALIDIISIAQQARPNAIGQMEFLRPQLITLSSVVVITPARNAACSTVSLSTRENSSTGPLAIGALMPSLCHEAFHIQSAFVIRYMIAHAPDDVPLRGPGPCRRSHAEGAGSVLEINAKHDLQIPNSLLEIIRNEIREIPVQGVRPIPLRDVEPRLPYNVPPKIWCIGLNYKTHAEDINAAQPEEPGSFMKPASCMFQPGGEILLPPPEVSNDVDAEGELGVIIGRSCRFVPAAKAREVIYGFTTTLDLTALDVLRKNPRYLTRAKSIDTFFSFGPVIVTADEVPDIEGLEVVTEHNGAICSRDFVRNMKTRPLELVAFHSNFFTFIPVT